MSGTGEAVCDVVVRTVELEAASLIHLVEDMVDVAQPEFTLQLRGYVVDEDGGEAGRPEGKGRLPPVGDDAAVQIVVAGCADLGSLTVVIGHGQVHQILSFVVERADQCAQVLRVSNVDIILNDHILIDLFEQCSLGDLVVGHHKALMLGLRFSQAGVEVLAKVRCKYGREVNTKIVQVALDVFPSGVLVVKGSDQVVLHRQ